MLSKIVPTNSLCCGVLVLPDRSIGLDSVARTDAVLFELSLHSSYTSSVEILIVLFIKILMRWRRKHKFQHIIVIEIIIIIIIISSSIVIIITIILFIIFIFSIIIIIIIIIIITQSEPHLR